MGAEASLNLDTLLAPGTVVGEYVIENKLGEGGMGAVFAARHPLIGKRVAVKVLSPALASSAEAVERFMREARSVNEIGHRNIVDIFSFGTLPVGLHYYIMEHLDGRSLHDELARIGRPLTFEEIQPYMRPVFSALAAAHARGIVHRDLKPENIYVVDQDGPPLIKLLDFGIAKLATDGSGGSFKTRTGVPMGTPYYMSPEQCLGRGVDQRSDIYALGIILYQMATGKLPFAAESYLEVLQQQLSTQAEPPSHIAAVPPHVERAIQWAMQKDAALRPQSVEQLWEALEGKGATIAQTMPTLAVAGAPAPSLPGDYFTQPGVTRAPAAAPSVGRRWLPAVVVGGVLVVGIGVMVALRSGGSKQAPVAAPVAAAALPAVPAPAPAPPAAATIPAMGMLRVDVTPTDATLTVDGAGIVAGQDLSVPAGPHRVHIERAGYVEIDQRVEVAPDGRLGLRLSLEKSQAASATPRATATKRTRVRSSTLRTPTKVRDKDDTARPSWMQ